MITRRWGEIIIRASGQNTEVVRIVREFVAQLTSFLPWLLGSHTDQLLPLSIRTPELFGAISAKPERATGEVIEELQILREVLINPWPPKRFASERMPAAFATRDLTTELNCGPRYYPRAGGVLLLTPAPAPL